MVVYSYGGVTSFIVTQPGTPAPIGEAATAPAERALPPGAPGTATVISGGGVSYGGAATAPTAAPTVTKTVTPTERGVLTHYEGKVPVVEGGETTYYPLSAFPVHRYSDIYESVRAGGYVEVGPPKPTVTPYGAAGAPYAGELTTYKRDVPQLVTPAPPVPVVGMGVYMAELSTAASMGGESSASILAKRARGKATPWTLAEQPRVTGTTPLFAPLSVGAGPSPEIFKYTIGPAGGFVAGATIGAAMLFPSALAFGYEVGTRGPRQAIASAITTTTAGFAVAPAFTLGTFLGPTVFYGGAAALLRPAPPVRVGVTSLGVAGVTQLGKLEAAGITFTAGRAALVGRSFATAGGRTTQAISRFQPRIFTATAKPPIAKAPFGAVESASLVWGDVAGRVAIPRGRIGARLLGPYKYKTFKEPVYTVPEATPALFETGGVQFRKFWYPGQIGKRPITGAGEMATRQVGRKVTLTQTREVFTGPKFAGIGESRIAALDITKRLAGRGVKRPAEPPMIRTPGLRGKGIPKEFTAQALDKQLRPLTPKRGEVMKRIYVDEKPVFEMISKVEPKMKMDMVTPDTSAAMGAAAGAAFEQAQLRVATQYAPAQYPGVAPSFAAPPATVPGGRMLPQIEWDITRPSVGGGAEISMQRKIPDIRIQTPQQIRTPISAPSLAEAGLSRDVFPGALQQPGLTQLPGTGMGIGQLQAPMTIPGTEQRVDIGLKPITWTTELTQLKTPPGFAPGPGIAWAPPSGIFVPPPYIPGGGLTGMRPSEFKYKAPKRAYRPSLGGVALGLTAKKAPKGPFTGFGIRPVVPKKKRQDKTLKWMFGPAPKRRKNPAEEILFG